MNQNHLSFDCYSFPLLPSHPTIAKEYGHGCLSVQSITTAGSLSRNDHHISLTLPKRIESSSSAVARPSSSNTSSSPTKQRTTTPEKKKVQPISDYDVIVGRGKEAKRAIGNRRLTVLAKSVLPEYTVAKNKIQKTKIVSSLMKMIHGAGGVFVRVVDGGVEEVKEHVARVKIGSVLRNLLSDKYLSSSKSRVKKRQVERHNSVGSTTSSTAIEEETIIEPRPIGKDGGFCCQSSMGGSSAGGAGNLNHETPASLLSLFEFLDFTFDDKDQEDTDDQESL